MRSTRTRNTYKTKKERTLSYNDYINYKKRAILQQIKMTFQTPLIVHPFEVWLAKSVSPKWKWTKRGTHTCRTRPETPCIKLITGGNSAININYHSNITQKPIKSRISWNLQLWAKLPSIVKHCKKWPHRSFQAWNNRWLNVLKLCLLPKSKYIQQVECNFPYTRRYRNL